MRIPHRLATVIGMYVFSESASATGAFQSLQNLREGEDVRLPSVRKPACKKNVSYGHENLV